MWTTELITGNLCEQRAKLQNIPCFPEIKIITTKHIHIYSRLKMIKVSLHINTIYDSV